MTSRDLSGSNVSSEWVVLNTKYQKRVEYDEMGIPFYEMVFIYRNILSVYSHPRIQAPSTQSPVK